MNREHIEDQVKGLCKYFDWEENSEQANEIRKSLLSVASEARKEALEEVRERAEGMRVYDGMVEPEWARDTNGVLDAIINSLKESDDP